MPNVESEKSKQNKLPETRGKTSQKARRDWKTETSTKQNLNKSEDETSS